MKLKLQKIKDGNDKNRYCGPSVISALTKLTTGEAARLVRMQTGRSSITGTGFGEVRDALAASNIRMQRVPSGHPPITLARWLRESKEARTPGRVYLLDAGNHWQLVSGRRYVCGRIREIVSIRDKRVKRRARVSIAWELFSDDVTKPEFDVSKPKDLDASDRAKARRIEKQIGAEIDLGVNHREYKDMWVSPPKSIRDADDPYEGDHRADTWGEALEMLQDYKKIIDTVAQYQWASSPIALPND